MVAVGLGMAGADYETTIFRAVPALLGGAVAGASIVVLFLAIAGVIDDGTAPGLIPGQLFNTAFMLAPMVFMTIAAGALFVAVPCWWVLHRMGRRTRGEAALLGLILCSAFGFVPLDDMMSAGVTPRGALEAGAAVAVLALAGAVAGLTIWRIAYRSADPT
jgi:hypothetical protein